MSGKPYKYFDEESRRLARNAASKAWRERNPEKARQVARRSAAKRREKSPEIVREHALKAQLKFHYGLTYEQYKEMVALQHGRCKICYRIPSTRLAVDHCHKTGYVRGLLCRQCNSGIGLFRENPITLRKAAAYVSRS